jgi:hypothetical protein
VRECCTIIIHPFLDLAEEGLSAINYEIILAKMEAIIAES